VREVTAVDPDGYRLAISLPLYVGLGFDRVSKQASEPQTRTAGNPAKIKMGKRMDQYSAFAEKILARTGDHPFPEELQKGRRDFNRPARILPA
jgi:hypothetical protein